MRGRRTVAAICGVALLACSAAAFGAGAGVEWRRGVRAPQLAVAAATIYPGEIIRPGMLVKRRVPRRWAMRGGYVTDPESVIGKMARITIVRGRPVPVNAVREPWAVRNGAVVRVLYQAGALTISALGRALQNASAGERVPVRNVDSGRIVYGVARRDGTVVVPAR